MIVFNEGVPRAGKFYDVVKNHILPALVAGRHVYARLNGLDVEAIAAYLKLPQTRIEQLLHLVDTESVVSTFAAKKGDGGRWTIPLELRNSLIVIDEVHEFYVQSRAPLPPDQENFFALIGQNGGDVVIITQWIKRVHPAVRARIERKNNFQKLSAVGSDKSYRVTYYQTLGPDKFEKVGGSTERYDAAIYPLYHGYAVGADNVAVYKSGGTTVWRQLAPKLAIFGLLGVAAVWYLGGFFTGNTSFSDQDKTTLGSIKEGEVWQQSSDVVRSVEAAPAIKETLDQKQKRERTEALALLTASQRYVVELAARGRVRLAVRVTQAKVDHVILEWIGDNGLPVERLTGVALADMGFKVDSRPFGVLLTAGTESIVATQWPLIRVVREAEAQLYRIDNGAPAPALPSEASQGGRRATETPQVMPYGAMRES
jgi:zona occludens toxin